MPTAAEQGLAGVESSAWNGYFYPKGTPREIVMKMNTALSRMVELPHIQKRLEEFGLEILPPDQRTPEYMAEFLPRDIARWGKVIRDAGLAGIAGN